MPRRPRVFLAGAIYHVYCRTGRREQVFAERDEAERFVALLRDTRDRDGFAMLAWCLMPTHVHLVLRTAEVPLWRSMRLIQGRFAQDFNRRRRTLGSLWQERYKAKLIDDQAYLGRVLAYVHLNPVAAGLARSPAAWTWSGHRELMGAPGHSLIDTDEALSLLGETLAEARRVYRGWLAAVRKETVAADAVGAPAWWRHKVDPEERAVVGGLRPRIDGLGASTGRVRPRLAPDEYLARAATAAGSMLEALSSPRRDRQTVRAREAVMLLGVERYGQQVRALAVVLGRTADQVSRWAGQGSRRKAVDPEFLRRLDAIDEAITGKSEPR